MNDENQKYKTKTNTKPWMLRIQKAWNLSYLGKEEKNRAWNDVLPLSHEKELEQLHHHRFTSFYTIFLSSTQN